MASCLGSPIRIFLLLGFAILYQLSLLGPFRIYQELIDIPCKETLLRKTCRSPILERGTYLLEFAGYPNYRDNGFFLVEKGSQRLELPNIKPATKWKRLEFETSGGKILIEAHTKAPIQSKLFKIDIPLRAFILALKPLRWIILIVMAGLISTLRPKGLMQRFLSFILISLATQFRFELFFREDDWMLLERTLFEGLTTTHNEHYIPLFYIFYSVERLFFGQSYVPYIVVSSLLHAANGALLFMTLRWVTSHRTAHALTLLYIVSPLHGETMQWLTMQCSLLSTMLGILALYLSLDMTKSHHKRSITAVGGCIVAAPLFFGLGLCVGPLICIFAILRRSSAALTLCSIGCTLFSCVLFLLMNSSGEGGFEEAAFSTSYFLAVIEYISYGVFVAVPARALGFYSVDTPLQLSIVYGIIGFAALLFIFRNSREERFWMLYGMLFMVMMFSLPALGRISRGAEHALVLRYNAPALVGMIFLLAPLLSRLPHWTLRAALPVLIFTCLLSSSQDTKLSRWGQETYDLYQRSLFWQEGRQPPLRFRDRLGPQGKYLGTEQGYQVHPRQLLTHLTKGRP